MPLQQDVHHVAGIGIALRCTIARDDVQIVGRRDDSLGEQEPGDEVFIVARHSHGDRQTQAAQPNIQGLLDRSMVVGPDDTVLPVTSDGMPNRRSSCGHVDLWLQTHRGSTPLRQPLGLVIRTSPATTSSKSWPLRSTAPL